MYNKIVSIICSVFSLSQENHKKTPEDSQLENTLLTKVISNIPHFVFWKNSDLEYLGCNKKFAQRAGVKCPENIIGKTDYDLALTKEDADFYRKCDREVMSSGIAIYDMEETEILADGKEKIFLTSKVPLRDDQGNVAGIIGIFSDITERKKLQSSLLKSEEKYRTLFEEAIDSIFIAEIETGIIVDCNKAATKLTGRDRSELIGQHQRTLHPQENKGDEYTENFKRHAYGEIKSVVEDKVITKNGKIKDVEIKAILFEDGDKKMVQGTFHDVIERKKMEKELKSLAKFPGENPNPVLRISKDGIVLYSNRSAANLLSKLKSNIGKKAPKKWHNFINEALMSEKVITKEIEIANKTFSLDFISIRDSGYVNVYGRDITNRKLAEKEILENQEQLKALAIELSLSEEKERRHIAEGLHDDIIQPLFFLDIKLKTLLDGNIEDNLSASCQQMRSIIQDLISKIRNLTFEFSNHVLHELGLEKAIQQWLISEIKEKNKLKVVFQSNGDDSILDYDMQTFMFKAAKELLVNVVKHAKATTVKVTITKNSNAVLISVEDDGVGFTINSKTKTGFGLFNLRNRIDHLGGYLAIDSKPANGTKAVIVMPLKKINSIQREELDK